MNLITFRSDTNYKNKSLKFLKNFVEISDAASIEEYTNIWNQAREKRQREFSRWFAAIKAIYANDKLETLVNQLFDSIKEAKKSWLPVLDNSRLNTISTDILDILKQYLRQSGYREKERYFGIAQAQIDQLINEIKDKPTKFSYDGFIPLLEKINYLLEKSFKLIEDASIPKVKILILGGAIVIAENNFVTFQVSIENSKESSPIRDIKINVENTNEIKFIPKQNSYYDSIDGGDNCILTLNVKVSEKVKIDKATSIDVNCEYHIRNQDEPVIIQEQLSLNLLKFRTT